jgi:uncharacterized membrane protein
MTFFFKNHRYTEDPGESGIEFMLHVLLCRAGWVVVVDVLSLTVMWAVAVWFVCGVVTGVVQFRGGLARSQFGT